MPQGGGGRHWAFILPSTIASNKIYPLRCHNRLSSSYRLWAGLYILSKEISVSFWEQILILPAFLIFVCSYWVINWVIVRSSWELLSAGCRPCLLSSFLFLRGAGELVFRTIRSARRLLPRDDAFGSSLGLTKHYFSQVIHVFMFNLDLFFALNLTFPWVPSRESSHFSWVDRFPADTVNFKFKIRPFFCFCWTLQL